MPTKRQHTSSGSKWIYLIVVIVLSAAAAATWYFRQSERPVLQQFREKALTYTIYEGITGERTKITLPDGTPVLLNSNTRLLVPADFPQHDTLLLDGEAYFDTIAHPLTVKTNILTMTTQAPTSFKLRCFEAQQGATAYVLRGQVQVKKSYYSATDNQPELLGPGNMVLANKEIDLMEKETYHPIEMETWLRDTLIFHEEPFMNAVRKLEEWYSTEIYVEGDISAAGTVNGNFAAASLTKVLDSMQQSAKFKYKIKKNKVMIRF